jgi:DNA polymerase III alpha subunit (gram-positive type)
MSYLTNFPEKKKLLDWFDKKNKSVILNVNGHIHSPYSFSAFRSIEEMYQAAKKENIKVLGINDFNVTDGYEEFYKLSLWYKIFPLFNIEFISLSKEFQQGGILVNDPNNPGRIYFSGKGLRYPLLQDNRYYILTNLKNSSQEHVQKMTVKLDNLLSEKKAGISLNFVEVREYSKALVRERHIAMALREKVYKKYTATADRKKILEHIYGRECKADFNKDAEVENEIRSNLLKAGGQAFIPEDENSFIELSAVKEFIINAGGIPCYPVLLDYGDRNFTNFEKSKEEMMGKLLDENIFCIEFIPGRNTFDILKEYVKFFRQHGFLVMFGTEHNTTAMEPLSIRCKDRPLDGELRQVSYEGACVTAAHQYLTIKNKKGYIDSEGNADISNYNDYVKLGDAVINYFLNL